MSLVGPRPPIPYEVKKYENWHFRRVLEVKPGITGLWQVEGRSITTFNEMVRLDIAYVNNFSLWLDLKILFKTIWVVFSAKGAY
jgi:lipopolysaccharide/colanic/teichoic acid biosynthesis glycosyltransferase